MPRRVAVLCALLLCFACSEPPQKEIDHAQGAIDAARAAGAERYAPAEFTAATEALSQAHEAVAQRDYRTALSRALTASERAQAAAKQAADGKARARSEAEGALNAATTALQQLRTSLKTAEAQKLRARQLAPARKAILRVDATLQEARTHLAAERYLEASAALKPVIPQVSEQIRALTDSLAKAKAGRRR
jgi:hypothetical protein